MYVLRRFLPHFLIFLVVCIFSSVVVIPEKTAIVSSGMAVGREIIIDAGHGGFDGGAQAADGTLEKNINLSISLKLKEFLELGGFNVIMTREVDSGTEMDSEQSIGKRKVSDMKERLKIINSNPDAIFVSIHLNKFTTSSAKGTQVFYSQNNEKSKELAQSIQSVVINQLQQDNSRVIKKGDKSIYLLKNAKIPAVIVECGFLSNEQELSLLKQEDYQKKIAFCVYCGILDYYKA